MRFSIFVGMLLASYTSAAALTPRQATGPDPNSVYIQSVSYTGDGCPPGSVSEQLYITNQTYSLIFDKFLVKIGDVATPADATRSCDITFNMNCPAGVTNQWHNGTMPGLVQLDEGFSGVRNVHYASGEGPAPASFTGLFETNVDSQLDLKSNTPCSGGTWSLTVHADLSLTGSNPSGTGMMSLFSLRGMVGSN